MAWIYCIVYDGMAFLPMRVKDGLQGGARQALALRHQRPGAIYELKERYDNMTLRLRSSI